MEITSIAIERVSGDTRCGTLSFNHEASEGFLLWIMTWQEAPHVVVEFIPAKAADDQLVRSHHPYLVDTLLQAVVARMDRRFLFRSR